MRTLWSRYDRAKAMRFVLTEPIVYYCQGLVGLSYVIIAQARYPTTWQGYGLAMVGALVTAEAMYEWEWRRYG